MNGPFAIPVPQIRCVWAMGIGDKWERQGSSVVVCFKYRTPHRPYATGPSSVSTSGWVFPVPGMVFLVPVGFFFPEWCFQFPGGCLWFPQRCVWFPRCFGFPLGCLGFPPIYDRELADEVRQRSRAECWFLLPPGTGCNSAA